MMLYEMEQDDLPQGSAVGPQLVQVLYRGWWIIAICIVVAVLHAINYLHSATYVYSAQMQVTPPQSSTDDGSATSRAGAFGGLAALANIALPTNQSGMQFRLFTEILTSRDLIDEVAKDPRIMRTLFSGDWDEATQSWREPPRGEYYDEIVWMRALLGLVPLAAWHPPDGSSLQLYLGTNLRVLQDNQKPFLVKVTFTYPDRDFAIYFLDVISKTADNLLRQKALQRTKNYVGYLTNELKTVTIVEHRLAITQALSEQERYAMVANSGSPFAADIFERPWASSQPIAPRPSQFIMMSALVGAGIGVVLAFAFGKFGPLVGNWFRVKFFGRKPSFER